MSRPERIVVFHTAFLGDIILSLPMVQVLKRSYPETSVSFLATPTAAAVLRNHPSIDRVIEYDKKGEERGLRGMLRCIDRLREGSFDLALIPHRSLRSAMLPFLAGVPRRIGFSNSAGRFLLTERVPYERNRHEIIRNLSLLRPLGIEAGLEPPSLHPSPGDIMTVDRILAEGLPDLHPEGHMVAVAPGSIWETKRWPEEKFAALTKLLTEGGYAVALIGSRDDRALAGRVGSAGAPGLVLNTAGQLSILQSAELIGRCAVLVSNDSAPMHAGVAMRTPVVALFGATVPGFGFAPIGSADRVLQTEGLTCRPCSIHGGRKCPIGTFDCMRRIDPGDVFQTVLEVVRATSPSNRKYR